MFRFARAIVVDLEVTCDHPTRPPVHPEIIEVGVVPVDLLQHRVLKSEMFELLVKPGKAITPYCAELTGLSNAELIAQGLPASEAVDILAGVCRETTWVSWGGIEHRLLQGPDFEHHLDLQKWFCIANGFQRRLSLRAAMRHERLEFFGKEHQALNDAYQTARLLIKMVSGKDNA